MLPPELLGLVALAVFVLVVFGVLPDDDLEEEARRTEAPERRVVAVRVVRTFLPCAAKESAATCASAEPSKSMYVLTDSADTLGSGGVYADFLIETEKVFA